MTPICRSRWGVGAVIDRKTLRKNCQDLPTVVLYMSSATDNGNLMRPFPRLFDIFRLHYCSCILHIEYKVAPTGGRRRCSGAWTNPYSIKGGTSRVASWATAVGALWQ